MLEPVPALAERQERLQRSQHIYTNHLDLQLNNSLHIKIWKSTQRLLFADAVLSSRCPSVLLPTIFLWSCLEAFPLLYTCPTFVRFIFPAFTPLGSSKLSLSRLPASSCFHSLPLLSGPFDFSCSTHTDTHANTCKELNYHRNMSIFLQTTIITHEVIIRG